MTRRQGRGRQSSIDLLPEDCDPIIAWAAGELAENSRTQQDIYEEFYTRLGELMADSQRGTQFPDPVEIVLQSLFDAQGEAHTAACRDTRDRKAVIAEKFPGWYQRRSHHHDRRTSQIHHRRDARPARRRSARSQGNHAARRRRQVGTAGELHLYRPAAQTRKGHREPKSAMPSTRSARPAASRPRRATRLSTRS